VIQCSESYEFKYLNLQKKLLIELDGTSTDINDSP